MAALPPSTLSYALGIELPGGAMRTFLEAGQHLPTPDERVRLVSRLRDRTRLRLRILARNGTEAPVCVGELRLGAIKLNQQGEAQLLVSLQSTDGEYVQVQVTDELTKTVADAAFRIGGGTGSASAASPAAPAGSMEALERRLAQLERELERSYGEEGPASGNPPSANGSPSQSIQPPQSSPSGEHDPSS